MITVNQAHKNELKMHGSIHNPMHSSMHDPVHGSVEYKSIYFIVFSSILFILCLSSLARKLIHPLTSSTYQHRESPLAQARSAADSSVPYIFKR